MGDYAAALPLHRQALEVFRTALGENHNSSGRFRGWLKALTYQAWRDLAAERRRSRLGVVDRSVSELLGSLQAGDDLVEQLDAEFRQEVMDRAMERVRRRVSART